MENIQNINIDIMNNKTYEYIYTKQYDVGREIVFHITQDGEAWGESGLTVIFELMKPDGYCIIENLEYDSTDKTATLVLDEQCTCVAGRLPYQLTFSKDNKLISTVSGKMICDKAVVQDGDIKSNSSGNLIEDLVEIYDNKIFIAKTVALPASGWDSETNRQTVGMAGIIPEQQHQLVMARPTYDTAEAYWTAEVRLVGQGDGTLTFECTTIPTNDIDVLVTADGIDSRLGNIAFTYSSVEPGRYDQNEDDVWIQEYTEDPVTGEQSVSNVYSAEFMPISGGGDLPVYNTIQIDDTNGDIVLINNTTWDGTNTSLKAAIMALQGGGGGVQAVHLTPEEYEELSPEEQADTSKIYFVDEEEEEEVPL